MSSFEPDPRSAAASGFVPDPLPGRPAAFADVGGAGAEPKPSEPTLEERLQQAYQEGAAAGRAELPWQEAEALRASVNALAAAGQQLATLRHDYWVANRELVLDLALAVAGRLVERELSVNRDALAEVVERAVERLPEPGPVRVCLAAADVALLERGEWPALRALAERHALELVADPELQAGEVRVIAGPSEMDARPAAVLERLRDELSDALGVAPPEPEATP